MLCLLQICGAAGRDGDARAFLQKAFSAGKADALAAARYQDDFAIETQIHSRCSSETPFLRWTQLDNSSRDGTMAPATSASWSGAHENCRFCLERRILQENFASSMTVSKISPVIKPIY
jgi:hypothetical protein